MLNRLKPLVVRLRDRHPALYHLVVRVGKRFLGKRLGVYPRILGGEIEAVSEVLRSSQWNMAYGRGLAHERLEADFADYVGVPHAIAVASGGVALQMSMRALGIGPGDEVIHQVDTCSATAMAVMNAAATPIFADISARSFMLDLESVGAWTGPSTRALIATHMWGNPEQMSALRAWADETGSKLIEDACLGLGAVVEGRPAGSWGDVGVFSFGCIKPIQGGEGGMIVTGDSVLARELRAMRHWGDRTIDFGERDVTQLSWNGRMSEIVAAVVREQLRGYPRHLAQLRESVADFSNFLGGVPGLSLVLGASANVIDCAFTQVVLRLEENVSGISKQTLWDRLSEQGIPHWHGNFELINSLSLFNKEKWRDWILRGDLSRPATNYVAAFPNAQQVFDCCGLGLAKMNFLSPANIRHLKRGITSAVANSQ
jgi:perosamine synthetase